MNQCPVCASPRTSSGAGCSACDFPFAFAQVFASAEAKRCWDEEVALRRQRRSAAQAKKRTGLAVLTGQIACIENRTLRRFGAMGECEFVTGAVQVSQSHTHTLTLLADGKVLAEGSNRMGQCMVQNIRNAAFVLAGPNVSYIVTRDGRVQTRGVSPVAQAVSEWTDIREMACGDHFAAGLTRDGSVRIASDRPEIFRNQPSWSNIESIAAGGDYLIALDKYGRVFFAGSDHDERRDRVTQWRDIAAIVAEDMYAVGLTQEGRVLLAGEGGWLDRGRSEAANWTDISAIAAGCGAIAAVGSDGRLHIAGSIFASTAGRESIIAQWGRG